MNAMNRAGEHPPNVPIAAATGGLLLGGSSTFLVNLSAALAARGTRFPVISFSESNEHAADFARAGNLVHCLPASKLIYEDRLARAYAELARYAPSAVLACLSAESFEVLRLVPSGVARIGIVQSHDPGPYRLVKMYAPNLDAVVGVSREIAEHLRAMPELAGVRIEYVPYGINFNSTLAPRAFDSTQPLRVIYVGRLIEEQKRVSRLVELVRMARASSLPAEFTFVGSGPAEAEMRSQLHGVPGVCFTGRVPNDRVSVLFAEHDVMVLLSDYEGLPLSLLEAMGTGVVPLVSDLPSGMRDAVPEQCGFRVPVGDICAAQNVLQLLCRERNRLRPLSAESAALARREFTAGRMAERYLSLASALGNAHVVWPPDVMIPAPYGLRPWLYTGLIRTARRWMKPLLPRRGAA